MSKRKRRKFTSEFKAEVVQLCRAGDRSIAQVAKDLDLTEMAVREWVKQAKIDEGNGPEGALTTAEKQALAPQLPALQVAFTRSTVVTSVVLPGNTHERTDSPSRVTARPTVTSGASYRLFFALPRLPRLRSGPRKSRGDGVATTNQSWKTPITRRDPKALIEDHSQGWAAPRMMA